MEELAVRDVSNINPLALLFLVGALVMIFGAGHRAAVVAFLLVVLLVPLGQQLVVLGVHLRFSRLLILAGVVRVLQSGEARSLQLTSLDRWFGLGVIVVLLAGTLRGAKLEMFGSAYDALGTYFLLRCWARDYADTQAHLTALAVAAICIAVSMGYELATHRNPFYVLGGVPEFTFERDGRFRCQGPFHHPILAGTFAAALFPLLVGHLFTQERGRWITRLGVASCVFCSYAAASSGAFLTLLGGLGGLALWPWRERMQLVRRTATVLFIALAIVMNAPVWYLISRVSEITGGTGWHRSFLIDQAVKHLDEWWLVGTSRTAHWAVDPFTILTVDPDNMDITNQYVAQGINGGLLGLTLFIGMIVAAFRIVGRSRRGEFEPAAPPFAVWSLGAALFAHCLAFLSVSYFDQIFTFWLWLLAVIAALARPAPAAAPACADEPTYVPST